MLTLKQIQCLLEKDIKCNDSFIMNELHSKVILIHKINNYIIKSGGKRIRPLLLMLIARSLNYKGQKHIKAAAIIEFIHTATLLHDDVVDKADLRRGKKTVNEMFGNAFAVLAGDFLYSRAFQIIVKLNDSLIMKTLADATNKIAEGEVLQLLNCHNPYTTEAQYMQIIYCKTSKLFEAACDIASILVSAKKEEKLALHQYGVHLGNAFQIADDILDYTSKSEKFGKNIGNDLMLGKITLPIIYILKYGREIDKKLIHTAITGGNYESSKIIDIVKCSGAIEYTICKAKKEADAAISALDMINESKYKEALASLPVIAVERTQ